MPEDKLRITNQDASAAVDDRFHRFRQIEWWDQYRLSQAKVLVVGAGALGNEIIKNLALLGVGNILIADLDRVENSNLSRSILFRETDNGQPKALVAARMAQEIYPSINAHAFHGDVIHELGLGVFAWADVILGGLDNREARLAINRFALKVRRPWIDGAIEQIQGCARVFLPEGPCYECTMSRLDWELLDRRRSCNLLTTSEMLRGRTPTTPTISSMIAGLQCQEAVKLLHGLPTIAGRGWVFDGLSAEGYQVEYQRKAECYSHEHLDEIISLPENSAELTVEALLRIARSLLGPTAELELARDTVHHLACPVCHAIEAKFCSTNRLRMEQLVCPQCQESGAKSPRREVVTFYKVRGTETFLDRSLAAIGIPAFDIVFARSPSRLIGFQIDGDAERILGSIAENAAEVDWK